VRKNDLLQKDVQKKSPIKAKSSRRSRGKSDLLSDLPRDIVTLDFEGADLKDVIRLMSETSNLNMIYGPEVTGSISVHLKQVPFDEAFRTILNLKGLVATQIGNNIIRIITPELLIKERAKAVTVTKTIDVNYIKASDLQ